MIISVLKMLTTQILSNFCGFILTYEVSEAYQPLNLWSFWSLPTPCSAVKTQTLEPSEFSDFWSLSEIATNPLFTLSSMYIVHTYLYSVPLRTYINNSAIFRARDLKFLPKNLNIFFRKKMKKPFHVFFTFFNVFPFCLKK